MPLISINTNPTRRELRQFAAIWFPAFWAVAGWFMWKATGNVSIVAAIWIVAATISVVGFFIPSWMRYIFVGWMVAAYPIGWAVSHLVLAVIYYGVITPIGLALRSFGCDPLQRHFDRRATTYWKSRQIDETVERYFRQY